MSKKEKLERKLLSVPRDMTIEEITALVRYYGYTRYNKGRTSGSRIMFVCDDREPIMLHDPHPRKELLEYQIKNIIEVLKREGLL